MIDYLNIKGFALIDELSLSLKGGLTVMTGETGAGKSIIVDALGDKVDAAVVRTGESKARVEASFRIGKGLRLPEQVEGGNELILNRDIPREGRGRTFINGSLIPVSRVKALGEGLVDLHGQHEHQSLLRISAHMEALDSYSGLTALRARHTELFLERSRILHSISRAEDQERDRAAREDYLRFVINELVEAAPGPAEEEELREEERVLASAERLRETSSSVLDRVYQSDGSLADGVGRALSSLAPLTAIDSRLEEIVDLLESSRTQLEEASRLLMDYQGSVQSDPRRLETVSDRLSYLGDLKKKYGPTLEDVLSTLESFQRELDGMLTEGEDLDAMRARAGEIDPELDGLASELTAGRRDAAARFEEMVHAELVDLAMEKVRFSIRFAEVPHYETGRDEVEFLISPNPGEPLMPLRKIASGGELSRVMLSLKRVLAENDAVPTLVFDEVDAGIGGRVAGMLGRKLKDISRHHQVLCITHLAPVAAFADHHLLVEKHPVGERTVVSVRYLDGDDRVRELARMMGGLDLTPGIVASARELLEESVV